MKMIYTAPSVVPCDMIKGMLESNGIPSMFKNEQGSSNVGVGWPMPGFPSVAWAWPELWVNDEDCDAALALVKAAEPPPAENEEPPRLPSVPEAFQ
ncbi:MAG: DUF2007 domain-containing protein [Verrucomicrobiota bacterium]